MPHRRSLPVEFRTVWMGNGSMEESGAKVPRAAETLLLSQAVVAPKVRDEQLAHPLQFITKCICARLPSSAM